MRRRISDLWFVYQLWVLTVLGCRLTECEKNQTEFDPARDARAPIRFRGTLEIRSLSWLTEKAVNAIEQELRERDLRARKRKTHFARPSNLTLRTLYAESRGFDTGQGRIKVTFEAAKAVAAIYLTCELIIRVTVESQLTALKQHTLQRVS